MWIGVESRFRQFIQNLNLGQVEYDRGIGRSRDVIASLNRGYFGKTEAGIGSLIVGSWGKGTAISPSGDVDIYYRVPLALYEKYDSYAEYGQSALLADVRDKLLVSNPQTRISADGQIVVVAFNSLPQMEIAPTFLLTDGKYRLPNTNDRGSWITADPQAENEALNYVDSICSNNARPLVRMAKRWRYQCNVPIKSFHLELLACAFLPTCAWKNCGFFYYDWIVRDFFRYLVGKANSVVFAPGTFEAMNIGDAWHSRAESALRRAEKACDYEYNDWVYLAGEEWQKIFGAVIPEGVS